MQLQLALLLSSKQQAEAHIYHPGMTLHAHPMYRLVVAEMADAACTLSIYHATYPDKADGKGWGEPQYTLEPQRIRSLPSIGDLIAFLKQHTINPENGWESVEDES